MCRCGCDCRYCLRHNSPLYDQLCRASGGGSLGAGVSLVCADVGVNVGIVAGTTAPSTTSYAARAAAAASAQVCPLYVLMWVRVWVWVWVTLWVSSQAQLPPPTTSYAARASAAASAQVFHAFLGMGVCVWHLFGLMSCILLFFYVLSEFTCFLMVVSLLRLARPLCMTVFIVISLPKIPYKNLYTVGSRSLRDAKFKILIKFLFLVRKGVWGLSQSDLDPTVCGMWFWPTLIVIFSIFHFAGCTPRCANPTVHMCTYSHRRTRTRTHTGTHARSCTYACALHIHSQPCKHA
jgi:hypothetical protein